MKTPISIFSVALLVALSLDVLCDTIPPVPLQDDNGDVSFVKHIVPKLLGRKPKGMLEVQLLADLSALHGRDAVVRTLLEQPEFSSHWTAYLVDQLKTDRDNQSAGCFNQPLLSNDPSEATKLVNNNSVAVAEFIRDNAINARYPREFNFFEVIQSSIELDNLTPIYRGYLFVLGSHPPGDAMRTEEERREELGHTFDDVFLNRDLECMACHNSTYSRTGIGDRTHPAFKTIDLAMYDANQANYAPQPIENKAYEDNCMGCHGKSGDGTQAAPSIMGADADEIEDALSNVAPTTSIELTGLQIESIAEALNVPPFATKFISETKLKHYGVFRTDFFASDAPQSGWGPWGMSTECASISGVPEDGPIESYFAGLNSDYLSPVDVDQLLWSGSESIVSTNLPTADQANAIPGDVAYAYLVATKITENVWQQLMGEPLTISNRYPRNGHQLHLLKHLTEDVFIAKGWSLKELIVEILASRFFNRRAPISSIAEHLYELPAVFDPFVSAETCRVDYHEDDDETRPSGLTHTNSITSVDAGGTRDQQFDLAPLNSPNGCRYNGVGDIVHRYAPYTLLNAIGAALDWPAPTIFPNNNYPSKEFMKAIGQYMSPLEIGSADVSFQSMLNWDGEYGARPQKGNDWINKVIGGIDEFNAGHADKPLTLGDVVLTVKDWLIQEPVFGGYSAGSGGSILGTTTKTGNGPNQSESQLVSNLFGGMKLGDPVTTASISANSIRQLCGVYLKTPQFMLAGIVRNDTLSPPRFRICNDEPCSYQSMCTSLKPDLEKLGYATTCSAQSVNKPPSKVFISQLQTR